MRRPRTADGVRNDVVLGLDLWHQTATIPGPFDEHVGAGDRRRRERRRVDGRREPRELPKTEGDGQRARRPLDDGRPVPRLGTEDEVSGLDELGDELARDEPLGLAVEPQRGQLGEHVGMHRCADHGLHTCARDAERRRSAPAQTADEEMPGEDLGDR